MNIHAYFSINKIVVKSCRNHCAICNFAYKTLLGTRLYNVFLEHLAGTVVSLHAAKTKPFTAFVQANRNQFQEGNRNPFRQTEHGLNLTFNVDHEST